MNINSLNTVNYNTIRPAFKGNDAVSGMTLESLKERQDEFRRMADNSGNDNGIIGKLTKFATKAIGVVITFTATKICLSKASDMVTGYLGKAADKVVEKAGSDGKLAKVIDKVKGFDIAKYAVNIISGGAAVGVALKDFGIVKKPVSNTAEYLTENSVDKAQGNGYNSSRFDEDMDVSFDDLK